MTPGPGNPERGPQPGPRAGLDATLEARRHAAETLFPQLYEELRSLAESRLAKERPGGTLQATALVHEAYLRVAGGTGEGSERKWDGRGHFFAAAAIAMRRILVERARARGRAKRGGGQMRVDLEGLAIGGEESDDALDMLALDAALTDLAAKDERKHEVVMLRFFAGLSIERTAGELGIAEATVERDWTFAKAWLFRRMQESGAAPKDHPHGEGPAGGRGLRG